MTADLRIVRGVCPVDGCGVTIATDRLMCPWHWSKVPAELRDNVYSAVRSYMSGSIVLRSLRSAQSLAIAAVETLQ